MRQNLLKQVLNTVNPGSYQNYVRNFSRKLSGSSLPLVDYVVIQNNKDRNDLLAASSSIKGGKSSILDVKTPKVMQVAVQDVKTSQQDEFGSMLIESSSDVNIKYGDLGIMPSKSTSPSELLKHKCKIEAGTMGVLNIRQHVPFLISSEEPEKTVVLDLTELEEVLDHEKNKNRYSMHTVCNLEPDDAKRLTLELQTKIYRDYKKENFYEEVTSRVYPPTTFNPSSGTLMSFEAVDINAQKGEATAMHYHPGQRSLHIITTNKAAGVTLNFCGIAENPDEREDSKVHLDFPNNSMIVLNFPPYAHHKFHGEFVCLSVHPREGKNLIEKLRSGDLEGGFLESATVFSKNNQDKDQWNVSSAAEYKSAKKIQQSSQRTK